VTRAPDPTTNTGGTCDGCGTQLPWGGTGWVPHTNEYHAARRVMTLRAAHFGLLERLGTRLGHHVQLRFTADVAWTECLGCTWSGAWVPGSAAARLVGRLHLVEAGRAWVHKQEPGNVSPTKGST